MHNRTTDWSCCGKRNYSVAIRDVHQIRHRVRHAFQDLTELDRRARIVSIDGISVFQFDFSNGDVGSVHGFR